MIERSFVTRIHQNWIFSPLKELLILAQLAGGKESTYKHIHVDYYSRSGKGGFSFMMKVVQSRMYTLMSIFSNISAGSLAEALQIAVSPL